MGTDCCSCLRVISGGGFPPSWRHAGGWGRAVSQVCPGYPQPAIGVCTVYECGEEFRVARYLECSKGQEADTSVDV